MFSMLWVYGKDFEAGFWWLIFLIIWRRCSLQQKLLEKQIVLLGCFYSNSFFVRFYASLKLGQRDNALKTVVIFQTWRCIHVYPTRPKKSGWGRQPKYISGCHGACRRASLVCFHPFPISTTSSLKLYSTSNRLYHLGTSIVLRCARKVVMGQQQTHCMSILEYIEYHTFAIFDSVFLNAYFNSIFDILKIYSKLIHSLQVDCKCTYVLLITSYINMRRLREQLLFFGRLA